MPRYYWTGGPGANVSQPLTTSSPLALSGQQVVAASQFGDDTLRRTSVEGRFMFRAWGNGTTTNPAEGYWTGLEAWVGLWCDAGDTVTTVPSDPFDTAAPSPAWVWTAFLTPEYYPLSNLDHGQSAILRVHPADRWSEAERKTINGEFGTQASLYLCWVFDSMSFPSLGSVSGGVSYEVGMDFNVRALWSSLH